MRAMEHPQGGIQGGAGVGGIVEPDYQEHPSVPRAVVEVKTTGSCNCFVCLTSGNSYDVLIAKVSHP